MKRIHWTRKILPKVMAVLTGHERYLPEIEWSNKSWTHNAFRLYELVLWRKKGIRAESTTGVDENGVSWVIVHSLEAAVAYTETFIRNAFALPKFKLVKVYIPQLAYAGGGVPTSQPYLFAIAYDTTANGTNNSSSSVTFSHTCTGSNLTLTIEGCQNDPSRATSSSATYAAAAATQIVTSDNAGQNTWMDILAKAAPATGANNVVWTQAGGGAHVSCFAMSLSGTAASPIGASASTTFATATSASRSVTTTAADSWIVDNFQCNKTVTATGTNQTKRTSFTGVGGNTFHGSTETTTTTGSYTVSYSWTGNADGSLLVAEIKALTATTYNQSVTANVAVTSAIVKQMNKTLIATTTSSASVVKQMAKSLVATATATASVLKQVSQSLIATATVTADMTAQQVYLVLMTALATVSATITKTPGKLLTATATVTASIAKSLEIARTLVATATVTGTMLKSVAKTLVATATATSVITKTPGKILQATANVTASISSSIAKVLVATATVSAVMVAGRAVFMTATTTVTAVVTKTPGKILTAVTSIIAKVSAPFWRQKYPAHGDGDDYEIKYPHE